VTDDNPFEGTPAQWYVFSDFVRRALHAAAEQIEPQADGLEPIRARIPAPAALEVTAVRRWRGGQQEADRALSPAAAPVTAAGSTDRSASSIAVAAVAGHLPRSCPRTDLLWAV